MFFNKKAVNRRHFPETNTFLENANIAYNIAVNHQNKVNCFGCHTGLEKAILYYDHSIQCMAAHIYKELNKANERAIIDACSLARRLYESRQRIFYRFIMHNPARGDVERSMHKSIYINQCVWFHFKKMLDNNHEPVISHLTRLRLSM